MSTRNIDTAELVERALAYAREHGAPPPSWMYSFAYTEEEIVFLGDSWYQIGHIQRRDWPDTYPIWFNPMTQQLHVKVPRLHFS